MCQIIFCSVLFGCGKGDEVESIRNTDTPLAIETSEKDLDTYKIGVAAPITGSWSKYGKGFDIATKLAVEKINADGGVNGRKLELSLLDSKGNVKEAAIIAGQFVDDKDVLAVVGDFSSACCMAAAPIYKNRVDSMVQLSPTAGSKDFTDMNEYMFGIIGDKDDEASFMVQYLVGEYIGAKKMSVIYLDNDWGKMTADLISQKSEELEVEIISTKGYQDGEEDFKSILEEVRKTNPDVLCVVMYYNDLITVSKQIKDMDWDIDICNIGSGTSQKTIELGGECVEGVMTITPFIVSSKNKELYDLASEFKERAGFDMDIKSACAYDAVLLLADSIGRCQDVTRQALRDELSKVKDFSGITGSITFTESGDIHRQYITAKILDGKWIPITEYK